MSEVNEKLNEEIIAAEMTNERDFVAQLMWLIAIITIGIGFVVLVGSAGRGGNFLDFVGAVIIFVNGILIMGFAKVIQLLTEIKQKL